MVRKFRLFKPIKLNNLIIIKGVDDIILLPTSGTCNTLPTIAVPDNLKPTTTKITTKATTLPPIRELSCNFEVACSWTDSVSSFNWKVVKASTAFSSLKGPNFDHTLNSENGSLLTPNVLPSLNSYATANYYSPFSTGSKCIEFYYYMYGPEVR